MGDFFLLALSPSGYFKCVLESFAKDKKEFLVFASQA
jgi:hypothetical protein